MREYEVTVIPGGGIGPEVAEATMRALLATGVRLHFDIQQLDEEADGLSENVHSSLLRTGLGLKGPTGTPGGGGRRSFNVALRIAYDLFANVRPVMTIPGVLTPYSGRDINIIIFRENLEDCYVGEEYSTRTGAHSIASFTRAECERIARFAFQWAREHGRKKMTIVHKDNILKRTHGLFKTVAYEVAKEYPEIVCGDLIADNCLLQLKLRPETFDCILAPNLIGDFLSDDCAGLIGGLGFAPGANIGAKCAIFEAVHGTAPDIAGKRLANPTSLMLSGVMLLEHIGEVEAAKRLRNAMYAVLRRGKDVTADYFLGTPDPLDSILLAAGAFDQTENYTEAENLRAVVEQLRPTMAERKKPSSVGTNEYTDAVVRELLAA